MCIYRPGSATLTNKFFDELSDALDRLATFVEPVVVTGDLNVRFDRPTDPHTVQLTDMLAAHGLVNHVMSTTHNKGGSLDVVITRVDAPPPSVHIIDAGLSDHQLLRWQAPLSRPCPTYITSTGRPWNRLDPVVFRSALQSSSLCRPECWSSLDVDALARMYDDELRTVLDRLVPERTTTCRRRASDPWFDNDCRVAKRTVRLFERDARRAARAFRPDATVVAAAKSAWYARRREYRNLQRQKRESFWQSRIESERSSPRKLWRSVDTLMGRGRGPSTVPISADDLHSFFDAKVAGVRASTDDAPPATYSTAPPDCRLADFRRLTADDVIMAVRQLPDKQCRSDPMPTRLLKSNVDVLAPFLVNLFNRSLSVGTVPDVFKAAYITPLLKKEDADPSDVKFYRPISNLPVLSKLLERLVAKQLLDYLTTSRLLPDLQSAYRSFHSTETGVLKVLSDILLAVDAGDLAMLALLDMSAAFDTVDHDILLRRLQQSYGLGGPVLQWFRSYLMERTQFVRCGSGSGSAPTRVRYGVPQGSVLGPILFVLYAAGLLRLILEHGLSPHAYADDVQVYGFCRPDASVLLQDRISACIADVAVWMRSNRLQLNAAKTEIIWFASARRQHQLPTAPIVIGSDAVSPVSTVRDLGVHLDADLSMRAHISKTVASCFASLRQIRSIRRSVPRPVLQSLVAALVISKLDYGSATLAGLPAVQLNRLQAVLNAAARLIFTARKYDHITPLLRDLHWLRMPERITFRLAMLVYRCQQGTAPQYLSEQLHRVADIESRWPLRSASTAALVVPLTRHSTIGDRAFSVAASRAWNDLSPTVQSAGTLELFRRRLKTELFQRSFGAD
jgi:hypothetical protein